MTDADVSSSAAPSVSFPLGASALCPSPDTHLPHQKMLARWRNEEDKICRRKKVELLYNHYTVNSFLKHNFC